MTFPSLETVMEKEVMGGNFRLKKGFIAISPLSFRSMAFYIFIMIRFSIMINFLHVRKG